MKHLILAASCSVRGTLAKLENMALPPCHCLFQFYVADGKLSCQLYQRSCDIFLGVPFNIASYALLTHMLAQQADLAVGDFVWTGGDCHLYSNHLQQADEQLNRELLPLPQLAIKRRPDSIFEYKYEDFEILNYESHPHIKGRCRGLAGADMISIIVAASTNNVIGVRGELPWKISDDLKRFKQLTLGKPIVMGRLPGSRSVDHYPGGKTS